MKDIKIFLKKKKKKSNNMVINVTKISQKMKSINWLRTEKMRMKKKILDYNLQNSTTYKKRYKNIFSFLLMFEKFSLNKKKCEKKYKEFLIFILCKFIFENLFLGGCNFENVFFKKILKCIF